MLSNFTNLASLERHLAPHKNNKTTIIFRPLLNPCLYSTEITVLQFPLNSVSLCLSEVLLFIILLFTLSPKLTINNLPLESFCFLIAFQSTSFSYNASPFYLLQNFLHVNNYSPPFHHTCSYVVLVVLTEA